ncbi:MAG: glycosyltransferase family 4 protein [Lutibacter sp.]
MKILYIGNNLVSVTGYQTAMQTLSDMLSEQGFIIYKSSSKKNKYIRLVSMCFSLIKLRRKVKILLIDTFSTKNFYYALIISQLARLFKLKYVLILHGGNLPKRLKNNPRLSKILFKNAHKIVSPSDYLAAIFNKYNYETQIIPNFINFKSIPFKKRTGFKPNILWVRAFDKNYNPELAIKAMNNIQNDFPNAQLTMVGPDKDGSLAKCKKLAEKYNLSKCVQFTGILKQIEWYELSKNFDIFINTTNIDNTPASVLEAMALGLPIVSTNVGGIPYIIQNEFNGFLISKNDEIELANTIKHLIINQDKTIEIVKNGLESLEKYSEEVIKKQWLNLLNNIK